LKFEQNPEVFPVFSEIFPILSEIFHFPRDVFKIPREEKYFLSDKTEKISHKITKTTCCFFKNNTSFLRKLVQVARKQPFGGRKPSNFAFFKGAENRFFSTNSPAVSNIALNGAIR